MLWQLQLSRSARVESRGQDRRMTARYEPLLTVSMRNFYFPGGNLASAGMIVEPGPVTAELLTRLGLLLFVQADGFVLALDTRGAGFVRLLSLFERNSTLRYPVRAGFYVRFEDPLFINESALPFRFNPLLSTIYVDNLDDLEAGEPYEVPDSWTDVLPLRPSQFRVEFNEDAAFLKIYDIFGDEVKCYPRCVSPEAVRKLSPDNYTCKDYDPDGVSREFVFVDLSNLQDGKYTLQFTDEDGVPIEPPRPFLYLPASGNPLMFIELALVWPDDEQPVVAHLREVARQRELAVDPPLPSVDTPFRYELQFAARRVIFVYVVVVPDDNPYWGLQVRAKRPEIEFERSPEFEFQGRPAFEFRASALLPLQQVPDYEFSLWGHDRRRGPKQQELVARLPIPGPANLDREYPDERFGAIVSKAYVYI